MLDLKIISHKTQGLCDYTQQRKVLTILQKRPLLTELLLHKKHAVQESVKFLGHTSGTEQIQSDFHKELLLVEVFSLPSLKSWTM